MRHPEYEFVTNSGSTVKLKWIDKAREYRAFKKTKYDWIDMKLGSIVPDYLREYIKENY